MTKIVYGERIGKLARLAVGCSAIIWDSMRSKVLLTRRADNGQWCLPSGRMEPGESVAETCVREVWEETGLRVRVARLLGVYTNPNLIIEYPDGNKFQIVGFSFEAQVTGGELGLSDETTDCGYFSLDQIEGMDMMEHHRERIADAWAGQPTPFVR